MPSAKRSTIFTYPSAKFIRQYCQQSAFYSYLEKETKMFAAAKEFNKTVWFIILATFMSRFTFLMVWPFLALVLYNEFGLNELEIGTFMTIAVSLGVGCGFFMA